MVAPNGNLLREIKTFPQLVAYLRDELEWPIASDNFEELSFDFTAEELGIDPKTAAKIQQIKQLRPLTTNQPWGIFFVKFEPKRFPVVALRKILSRLVIKKRASANKSERAAWSLHDLLFISATGEDADRQITLAHFSEGQGAADLPALKVIDWDELDTQLKLRDQEHLLREKLHWPANPAVLDTWRKQWASAFVLRPREIITTSKDLALRLAELARAIRKKAREVLQIETERGEMRKLYLAFQKALIHDLTEDDFADMYAQTITYGLFSAAVSRTTPDAGTFILADNLADMVPITNPFLRDMLATFLTVGGRKGKFDFDELGIQEVVELLNSRETNLIAVLHDFGNRGRGEDPVIHFYEDFLKVYDKKRKVERGVFYTPQPVVSYIVRSVHELLQTEFGLEDGLASTVTWGEMVKRFATSEPRPSGSGAVLKLPTIMVRDEKTNTEAEQPIDPTLSFVTILDPATGTATFLVEVIDVIHRTMVEKWKKAGKSKKEITKAWNDYVPKHLLSRLYGYELMMAPYAIAHMKIGLKLTETGYGFQSDERARIYLTNALEPPQDVAGYLEEMAPTLAHEAKAVTAVKRGQVFTVVLANPPYSKASQNLGDAFEHLIERFRFFQGARIREPGAILFERDINNDYVKFLGFFRKILESSGMGVLGVITSNSYLDGKNFRGVRDTLASTFERISLLNLNGDSRSGALGRKGISDQNVFEIETGVCILISEKRKSVLATGHLCYAELIGTYLDKCASLLEAKKPEHSQSTIDARRYSSFLPSTSSALEEYSTYPRLDQLFSLGVDGIKTSRDGLVIANSRGECAEKVQRFMDFDGTDDELASAFRISVSSWDYKAVQKYLRKHFSKDRICRIAYRPLDFRFIYYDSKLVFSHREDKMIHLIRGPNLALVCASRLSAKGFDNILPADCLVEMKYASHDTNSRVFPILLYDDSLTKEQCNIGGFAHKSLGKADAISRNNWNEEALATISVLNSPTYRSRFVDEIKNDFPALPLLRDSTRLRLELARLGSALSEIQLLRKEVPDGVFSFQGDIGQPIIAPFRDGSRLYITDSGFFDGVKKDLSEFHIAGYQVCKNWVTAGSKSGIQRKGRTLKSSDIADFRSVLFAISETIRIRTEIDEVIAKHGGWPGAFASSAPANEVTSKP